MGGGDGSKEEGREGGDGMGRRGRDGEARKGDFCFIIHQMNFESFVIFVIFVCLMLRTLFEKGSAREKKKKNSIGAFSKVWYKCGERMCNHFTHITTPNEQSPIQAMGL